MHGNVNVKFMNTSLAPDLWGHGFCTVRQNTCGLQVGAIVLNKHS